MGPIGKAQSALLPSHSRPLNDDQKKKKSAQHPVKKPNAQAMCGIQTRSHTHEPNQSPDLYSAGPRDSIQEKRSIQAKAVIHIVVECLILKILALS